MADLVSPGVQVKEKDLTASVRSEPTSIGATAIISNWGPMNEAVKSFSFTCTPGETKSAILFLP